MNTVKVTLTQDFTDGHRRSFRAGQTGTVRANHVGSAVVSVDFDGYEDSRAKNAALVAEMGMGWDVLPWMGLIPSNLLAFQNE